MSEITIDQLQEKCRILFEKRKLYEDAKIEASKLNADYEIYEKEIIEMLISLDMDKFPSKYGTISLRRKEYYHVPKTLEQKEQIRKYMEERGLFENYWSINSNSW